MQNNTALANTDPRNIAIASETASLIKASIAENTLKAYQRALRDLETFIWSNTVRSSISELHHHLTRNR